MQRLFRSLLLATLLIPILVLAVLTGIEQHHFTTSPRYKVKIAGYDPRDLLQGRYITYRYLWQDKEDWETSNACLYLYGSRPDGFVDVTLGDCDALPRNGFHDKIIKAPMTGTFYLDEREASAADAQLMRRDAKAVITFIVVDHAIRPVALTMDDVTYGATE